MMFSLFITVVFSYTLGSIPFGLLITRMAKLGDIRTIGSGNIGATNVMRTGRKGLGILTLLLDAGKGFTAVWIIRYIYGDYYGLVASLTVVLGHIFPIWLRFRGGKGVATALGAVFTLQWPLGAFVCVIWLVAFGLMRISALASLLAFGYLPIAAYLIGDYVTALLCLNIGALILYTHRSNIIRMLSGKEHSFRNKAP